MKIAVIDYGMGNLGSVQSALSALGCPSTIAATAEQIAQQDALILPGVGAFGEAIARLREAGLEDALRDHALDRGKPFLGICLGMQLVFGESEELGTHRGLGWVDGRVEAIPDTPHEPVPHVGWNDVEAGDSAVLYRNIGDGRDFYFDHSYHVTSTADLAFGYARYGAARLMASFEKGNILGVQFHPEKSQKSGLRLLRNFLNFATGAPQHA
jgi:glutamine amidotransferase